MTMTAIVRVIAIACIGVLAGIYLGHRAGAHYALELVEPGSFIQFQQIIHVHYVKFMPPLVIVALLAAVSWLVSVRARPRSTEFLLVAVSALAIAAIAALTRLVNVPLNDALMTWNPAAPPLDLRAQWAPWEQVNTIRVWLALIALVFEIVALNLRTSGGPRASAL
jgi:uncharacterized membrane protein